MSPDGSVIAPQRDRPAQSRMKTLDCDVHHALRSPKDLYPFLSQRWRDHLETYGFRHPTPFTHSSPYPKTAPALSRTDAWPANGGPPGSDLDFLRAQLLEPNNVEFGMLHLLSPHGMDQRNQEFGAALCRAINEWQVAEWTGKERRLKAAIVVPGEDAAASVAEIEHWAGNPDFVQVSMITHTIEPLGRRRYWPIFEAAARNNLPIGLHTSGFNGHAITGAGWSSYYVEEQHAVAISQQALAISLVCEGVLEQIPDAEGGDRRGRVRLGAVGRLAAGPAMGADARRGAACEAAAVGIHARADVVHHAAAATSRSGREDLRAIIDWIGWDRLLFATDYPHWDMDNPEFALKIRMTEAERRMIYGDNARAVYGL